MTRAALIVVAIFVLSSCGSGIDRHVYVEANERLFQRLPVYPGTRVVTEVSSAYRSQEGGPVIGLSTRFDIRLPRRATTTSVMRFFKRHLRPDWRLIERLDGPVLQFREANASISINLEGARSRILELSVDHAYFGKAGR